MLATLLTFNILLLGRIIAFPADARAPRGRWLGITAVQAVAVIALAPLSLWAYAAAVVIVAGNLALLATETRDDRRVGARLLVGLLQHMLIALIAPPGRGIADAIVLDGVWSLGQMTPWANKLQAVRWSHLAALALGVMVCLDECNMLIRMFFRYAGISPQGQQTDLAAYKRGGMIGNLERLLVFVFTIHLQFNAVAFILTAKSVARFNDVVEKKESAEYVLVGTLVSTGMAIGVGLLVPHLS